MSTRNFVPQNSGEGSIGTEAKPWGSGFFTKLAVSAITTAISVLTPAADANDSQPATTGWVRAQFQSILTTVLSACGLKYNIATNGYICFGSLFGGLILQWRNNITIQTAYSGIYQSDAVTLPIAMSNSIALLPFKMSDSGSFPDIHGYFGSNSIILQSNSTNTEVLVLVIGY